MKVYQKIAFELERKEPDFSELESIEKDYLPCGSGFDCGCKIIDEKRYKNRIVIEAKYHAMDDNGYYHGWYTYKIIVHPSFNGIALKIYGKDYNGLREYVGDCMYNSLDMEVVE